MIRHLSFVVFVYLEITFTVATCKNMSSKQLEAHSATYLRLKGERGHWHNQAHNPAIDNFEGERHLAMIELQKGLGQAGTPAEEIQRLMGPPTSTLNEPDMVLNHELTLKNDKYQYPPDTKIWIYEWRGKHDFVYFLISKDQKVIQSDWYHAYE